MTLLEDIYGIWSKSFILNNRWNQVKSRLRSGCNSEIHERSLRNADSFPNKPADRER